MIRDQIEVSRSSLFGVGAPPYSEFSCCRIRHYRSALDEDYDDINYLFSFSFMSCVKNLLQRCQMSKLINVLNVSVTTVRKEENKI